MASLFPSGPALPDFKSLVVKGTYHPSAPIHLALSHAANLPDAGVLMITPSRETMVTALREHNDDWMAAHSGQGNVLELSSCTKVFYPPSPAHFAYLVSMLTTDDQSQDPTIILDQAPSLVILIELSAYFLSDVQANPNGHPWTLASYMTLVARTLASFATLSSLSEPSTTSSAIALVLFDSQLDQLKLPVLKHLTAGGNRKPSKPENATFFVQKYFEMTAIFEEDDEFFLNSSQEDEREMDGQRRNRMQIFHCGQNLPFETQRWVEQPGGSSGGTIFLWD
ncbi:hypothetical protein MSAN_01475400 [Mycena sanguinolenta]|uniref:Uncharacterized protein n=1 Tax=Mycena sanguinolenta TaxID=230812 RepID=A0A8H6YBT8_9AGAR|nr:hypothetical protein MSAN_01475400 [Mycena sanguinolenta]